MRGLLNLDGSPTPLLLDAVQFSETGHLSDEKANNAVSRAGAVGAYQFLPKNLHNMGYGMPKNIPVSAVKDPVSARQLAGQYIGGVNKHHNFTNPIHSLAAYNWGAGNVDKWIAEGADFDKLPKETQDYVKRAMGYIQKQQGSNDMAALMSQGVNRTSQLPPQLQAEVATMRNNRVPEDRINNYISQRMQYYNTLPQAPSPAGSVDGALNAAMVNKAPAPAPQAMLSMPTEDNANLNIDGSNVDQSAILNQAAQGLNTAFSAGPNAQPMADRPISDVQSAINAGQSMQGRPTQTYNNPIDPQASFDVEAMAQRDASPNIPVLQDQGSRAQDATSIIQMQEQAGALTQGKRDDAVLTAGLGSGSLSGSDLIRIGTAMAGGASQGGLNALDRAGREFGAIEDRNRAEQLALEKAAAKAKGKEGGDDNAAQVSSGIVTGLIDEVVPIIDDDADGLFNRIFGVGGNTTGMFGKLLSNVGGTDANNLRAQLDTIRSNVGFDKLQAMREASPTGGALGNVSEKENMYLQSVLGNVEQSQSPEQLKRNLLRLREAYLDIVHGYGNRPSGAPNYSNSGSSSGGSMVINGVQIKKL